MKDRKNIAALRHRMVAEQIAARGITDPRILRAMEVIPRHRFVPYTKPKNTYVDGPLPIGQGQTISQPYITAYMTELLQTEPDHRVLEIGTGSGYQAALLATLCKEVYSVEIIAAHSIRARKTLEDLQFKNVHLRLGDGRDGWPDAAPFDRILVTAAAKKKIPDALVDQLAEGGRMILPLGNTVHSQKLVVCARMKNQIIEEEDLAVRFVPLVTAGLTHLPKRLATS